jgi:hypothetical protein
MLKEKYPFERRVTEICLELSKLKQLELPNPVQWAVDWDVLDRGNPNPAFFSTLKARRNDPVVYVFSIKPDHCAAIFDGFKRMRDEAAALRAKVGLRHKDYRNICHVPEQLAASSCLYVGSRKSDCSGRIQQHLGRTKGGQTGAMYLTHVLGYLAFRPTIQISVYFFEKRLAHLTEHMEYVFQTECRPILGKRSVSSLEPPDEHQS